MYSKCNRMVYASSVFNTSILDHNVYAYNAIIAGFIYNELPRPAFEFYTKMRRTGLMPDKFTFPCVIKACSYFLEGWRVRKIHGELFKFGLELDLFVGSALVHCYLKFELMEDAQVVFDELTKRDVVLWNAMINGYTQIGEFCKALEFFKRMKEEGCVPCKFTVTGISSVFAVTGNLDYGSGIHGVAFKMGYCSGTEVCNALIDMYGKCKCINEALVIFEEICLKDIFSWNSIIGVHEQCGDHDGSLRLFNAMLRSGFQPDLVTVSTVLPSCSRLAALKHGREIHGYLITNGLGKDDGDKVHRYINNAVMDMYAKCGCMREAQLVFNNMNSNDVASWNIMILGYGTRGFGNEALDMFYGMCRTQLKPDEITFVGVLSACSHAGLIKQGREFLGQMQPEYGIVPTIEHYTCVIDMLGRAGLLEEAYELLSTMSIQSNPVVWRAFLAACRVHGNATLAEVAAQQVINLEPEHCGSYVLMSNVYGADGRYHEASEVRDNMRQQNLKKTPGSSWIELGNGVYVFATGDRAHLDNNLLYTELKSLIARLHEHGYVPDVCNGTM